jgi:hypothetical protein
MKNYKKEFEELKEISIKLAAMAKNHAVNKSSTTDAYNKCIKKMFDLGCFPKEFDQEVLIDDLR